MLSKVSFWKAVVFTVVALIVAVIIGYAVYAGNRAFPEVESEAQPDPDSGTVIYIEPTFESSESSETVGEIYSYESTSETLPEYPE